MKKRIAILCFLALTIFQFCSTTKRTSAKSTVVSAPTVTYQKDILPIMKERCTPCHFPEQGKKKMLDTYEATKTNIADILDRVQLPQEDVKFMPFKNKKEPLNDSLIAVIMEWKKQNMPE